MVLLKGATLYTDGRLTVGDVAFDGGILFQNPTPETIPSDVQVYQSQNLLIVPGFADVHVHLREPGFSYKERISTGTLAAASAGYTALMSMPNLNPVPDSIDNLKAQEDIIRRDAKTAVYPYASLTVGEKGERLSDIEGLSKRVLAFSDDGKGVQREEVMREAMIRVRRAGRMIAAHCEDESLLRGGYIHDGEYAAKHNHTGICSASEYAQVARDIKLVEETGCRYHICHISAKETVELVRDAKRRGLPVTCETAPHYLTLTDADLREDGRFKMNPPLRSSEDRAALIEGLADGTVDIIATDHAPHSDEEKSNGLKGSLMGVVGLETAFPVLYTHLVLTGKVRLERLIDAMSVKPREIFGISGGEIKDGEAANVAGIELSAKWVIRGKELKSLGSSTPFEGMSVTAKCVFTIFNGDIIWKSAQEN